MSKLPTPLARAVLERLALPPRISPDLAGLSRVYAAWCLHVPFDNLRKRIALGSAAPAPLPGMDAEDFFEQWLLHGCGGTCWPSSHALHRLLEHLGFGSRSIAGSMGDNGVINHGSTAVRLGAEEFLVDSSMLTKAIVPLRSGTRIEDALHPVQVEADDGCWLVRYAFPGRDGMHLCRLGRDSVAPGFLSARYEASRSKSPFNDRLYARRNLSERVLLLSGCTRFLKDADQSRSEDLSGAELTAVLARDFGFSADIIARLEASGGLV